MKTFKKIGTTLGLLGALALGYVNPSYAEEVKKPKVAVFNFKYNTKERPNVEDMLTTGLGKAACISLYERSGLKKILIEQKIGKTGIVDDNTAVEVGRLAGVEKIILGSYHTSGEQARIDVRYIDVKTGEVEKTESIIGDKKDLSLTDKLAEKMNYELCGAKAVEDYNEEEEDDFSGMTYGVEAPPTYMGGGMTLSDEDIEKLERLDRSIEPTPKKPKFVGKGDGSKNLFGVNPSCTPTPTTPKNKKFKQPFRGM